MRRILFILTLLSVGLMACGQTGTGWSLERRKVNFRDSTYFTKDANFYGPFRINGTAVTSSAAELNILDGALTTYTELNYLVGVTSAIQTQINAKQATLVSGTSLKTVNGETLLGSGNISVGDSGTMVYPGAGIPISTGTGWTTSVTNNSVNWDTAYVRSLRWDGGSTNLTAATGRTSLGATTIGGNLFTLTNPSAITFPRFNADNTVTALSAANFKTALSLTSSDVGLGNVTNESKATMFTTPTFTGHPTIEGVTSTGATGTGNLVFSASPTFTGTVTGTFSGNLTGNVTGNLTGTASLVTGYTRNSGTITLSGGHGITLTTTGTTGVTLPTSGTLVSSVDTASMLTPYIARGDTASMLTPYVARGDTASMLSNYLLDSETAAAVTGFTPASGSLTLSGADAITLETTAATNLTLPTAGTLATTGQLASYALLASPTFTGTVTIPTPFTLGATSVTSNGTELNLLDGLTSVETYDTENYGATGTGDIVLGTGPTMTDVTITGADIYYTPLSTGTVVAGTGITAAMLSRVMYFNTAAAIDISADPQIANGTSGQIITIVGSSDTNTLTLEDGTGLHLSGTFVMGIGDTITLLYEGTIGDWVELGRSNN